MCTNNYKKIKLPLTNKKVWCYNENPPREKRLLKRVEKRKNGFLMEKQIFLKKFKKVVDKAINL